MEKNILLRTYLIVCAVIIFGFGVTSVVSYNSNAGIFKKDIERVSDLTTEGIYHKIDSIFTKPINVSLTMANDTFLKSFLYDEAEDSNPDYEDNMKNYLSAYKEKYGYDSVFLVSTKTNRYYHFNGVDRILNEGNPENVWYYDFLNSQEEYGLNIDNDEAAKDGITIFVNSKIRGKNGEVLGVVGVGLRVEELQSVLLEYEQKFDVQTYLTDESGIIELSTQVNGYEKQNLFERTRYTGLENEVLGEKTGTKSFWYQNRGKAGYIIAQYVPNLEWYLIIDNDTTDLNRRLSQQFFGGVIVIILVLVFVLILITSIIRRYNVQVIRLMREKEQEHRDVFQTATAKMYEEIHEWDITHNCIVSEATAAYVESLGISGDTPYGEVVKFIAAKQLKPEYQEGYVETFCTENILRAFREGTESLSYEFMISEDGERYHWLRITANLFYWDEDQSIRMFTYRQNIEAEKNREQWLTEQMQTDSLTRLYNKAATQELISKLLREKPEQSYAFLMMDIDNFKQVNDKFGHATGDRVIADVAAIIKERFHGEEITGRIGGDEFAVFVPVYDRDRLEGKLRRLIEGLHYDFYTEYGTCEISVSIGVSISPESGRDFETLYKNADKALYNNKKNGKGCYSIYSKG